MNKNAIIAILGIAVVALAVVVWLKTSPGKGEPTSSPNEGQSEMNPRPDSSGDDPEVIHVERKPLEPEATKRLHDGPVIVSSLFEASGRAEHGGYGKTVRGSYLYTTTVKARSEILSKEENEATGSVRVVEKRTFTQARDNLSLSELDVAIDLETLPVGQVKTFVDCAIAVVGGIANLLTGGAATPYIAAAKAAVASGFMALNAIDGTSARGLLGAFGVEIPENIEAFVNERVSQFAGGKLNEVRVALQSIEGKTFIITYIQAANGMPLNVDFKHEGGGPISEAEWEILRSANAFLDANAVPDTRCRVGDYWTIWADEAQELFGAAGSGRAEGKIRVERVEDQPDGAWTLKIEPSDVLFRSTNGTASGKMHVKDGNGLVDAKNASVKSLQATAEGNLSSLNKKRHALFFDFVKKLNGDANLRFTLSVDPDSKETAAQ